MLGLPETKLGMLPAVGGTRSVTTVLRPVVGHCPLSWLGSRSVPPRPSHWGYCILIADGDEDVEQLARRLAVRLAALPPTVAQAATRAVRAAVDMSLAEGLTEEKPLFRLTDWFSFD